jgi:DNA-binding Lrp family transcriptional regulator
MSSLTLSRELDIPLSTVQRRRKKLESNFLEFYYLPKVDKFGWRVAFVFVSIESGKANAIGGQLLSWRDSVIYISRTMGGEAIDLVVQVVFHDNEGLVEICDRIKAVPGVKNLFWTEMVSMMGKNTACFENMIDSI